MKIEFTERKWGMEVTFHPETPEEIAQLFRITNNMKKEPPSMHMSFYDKPVCYLSIEKVKEEKQKNSVSR